MRVPRHIWKQLLPRNDDQIGSQEFLAVILGVYSFGLPSCMLWAFVDNQSVLGSIVKGSCCLAELNPAIGKLWLDCAALNFALVVCRVESKANVADGPTRDFFSLLEELDAVFVNPRLPDWAYNLWNWPVAFQ